MNIIPDVLLGPGEGFCLILLFLYMWWDDRNDGKPLPPRPAVKGANRAQTGKTHRPVVKRPVERVKVAPKVRPVAPVAPKVEAPVKVAAKPKAPKIVPVAPVAPVVSDDEYVMHAYKGATIKVKAHLSPSERDNVARMILNR